MKKVKTLFRLTALTVCSIGTFTALPAMAEQGIAQKTAITQEAAEKIALDTVGEGTINETDFDAHDDDNNNNAVYEIEVEKADGTEHDIKIDAENGKVIEHDIDD